MISRLIKMEDYCDIAVVNFKSNFLYIKRAHKLYLSYIQHAKYLYKRLTTEHNVKISNK